MIGGESGLNWRCWRIRCQVDCPWDWRKQPLECRRWLFWLGVCRWRDSRPNLKAKRREALWTASVVSLWRFSPNWMSLGLVWCLPSLCINWRSALCLRVWWPKNPFFLAFSWSPTILTDFTRMKPKMRSSSFHFPSTVNHFPVFYLFGQSFPYMGINKVLSTTWKCFKMCHLEKAN